MKKYCFLIIGVFLYLVSCPICAFAGNEIKPVYLDIPFIQDYSIKYYFDQSGVSLNKVGADRNGKIQVLSSLGLLQPYAGAFLYPGTLETDNTYRPLDRKNISGLSVYNDQFVYLDDVAVFSNAWAGELYLKHQMPEAKIFAGGKDFVFLISDGKFLRCINNSGLLWEEEFPEKVIDIKFSPEEKIFRILTPTSLSFFSAESGKLEKILRGNRIYSFRCNYF